MSAGTIPVFDHRLSLATHELPDELSRGSLACTLVDYAYELEGGVIGLYGSWGSGKSFTLNLAINELRNRSSQDKEKAMPVVFEPWKYELEGNLAVGLVLNPPRPHRKPSRNQFDSKRTSNGCR